MQLPLAAEAGVDCGVVAVGCADATVRHHFAADGSGVRLVGAATPHRQGAAAGVGAAFLADGRGHQAAFGASHAVAVAALTCVAEAAAAPHASLGRLVDAATPRRQRAAGAGVDEAFLALAFGASHAAAVAALTCLAEAAAAPHQADAPLVRLVNAATPR